MTLEELVEEFAQNVAAQTDAIWRGDARTGNKHARRYLAAFEKLRARGSPGRDALAVLLTHPRMDVRVEAAAFLLRYRTAEARAVLEAAAAKEGMIPFIASQVLKNWEQGTWALDPDVRTSNALKGQEGQRGIELEGLVQEFAQHVAAQTDEIRGGSARKGNKHADRYLAAFKRLRAHGGTGRDALASLFTHPRMDVRVMAAAFLLRHRAAEARAVLEEAAKGQGLAALGAMQTLKNWEQGTWALDLEEGAETPAAPPLPEHVHVVRRAPKLPSPRLRLPASLKPYRSALQKALAPCLLTPQEGQAESRGCRYGGLPLVPPGTGWPHAPNGPLPFVGQLDFAELAACPGASLPLLPRDGILSVFYDIDGAHWGANPEDSAFWKLLWTPRSEEAVPLSPPAELLEEPDLPTRPYRLLPMAGLSLPDFWDTRTPLSTGDWSDEETEDYVELMHSLAGGENAHQVGGHPAWIQEDAREEAQRLSGGPPEAAQEWNLLWQLGSDEEVGLRWGSFGKLFLLLRDEDLRACRFERAWLVLQST